MASPPVKKLWLKALLSVKALLSGAALRIIIIPVPSPSRPGHGRIGGTFAALMEAIAGGAVRRLCPIAAPVAAAAVRYHRPLALVSASFHAVALLLVKKEKSV